MPERDDSRALSRTRAAPSLEDEARERASAATDAIERERAVRGVWVSGEGGTPTWVPPDDPDAATAPVAPVKPLDGC